MARKMDERWIRFSGRILNEDEVNVTLEDTDGGAMLRLKKEDYRKDKDNNIEIRLGSYAELFIKYKPAGCKIRSC